MTVDDLYEEFAETLQRQALKLTREPDAAEDLVQETFIRSLNHLQLINQLNRRQRRAWLGQTLQRIYLDRYRARQREAALAEKLVLEIEPPTAPDYSKAELDPYELVAAKDRALLEMRYKLGLSSREIGEQLDLPAATVRTRLRDALQKLRAQKAKFR